MSIYPNWLEVGEDLRYISENAIQFNLAPQVTVFEPMVVNTAFELTVQELEFDLTVQETSFGQEVPPESWFGNTVAIEFILQKVEF